MHSIIAFLIGILVGAMLMLVIVTAIFDFQNRGQE